MMCAIQRTPSDLDGKKKVFLALLVIQNGLEQHCISLEQLLPMEANVDLWQDFGSVTDGSDSFKGNCINIFFSTE